MGYDSLVGKPLALLVYSPEIRSLFNNYSNPMTTQLMVAASLCRQDPQTVSHCSFSGRPIYPSKWHTSLQIHDAGL